MAVLRHRVAGADKDGGWYDELMETMAVPALRCGLIIDQQGGDYG
jgi:hypothetical protein